MVVVFSRDAAQARDPMLRQSEKSPVSSPRSRFWEEWLLTAQICSVMSRVSQTDPTMIYLLDRPDSPIVKPDPGSILEEGGLSGMVSRPMSEVYGTTIGTMSNGNTARACFRGRCPGCNPPSVLSSICLIGENPRLQRRIIGVYCPFHTVAETNVSSFIRSLHQPFSREGESIIVTQDRQGIVSAPPHRLSPGTSYGTQRSPPCGWSFLKATTMTL